MKDVILKKQQIESAFQKFDRQILYPNPDHEFSRQMPACITNIWRRIMRKIIHQSRITITRENGPTRKAEIEGFDEPVYYGVHGGISKFYNVTPEEEHAATLDHMVGAVGG